MAYPARSSIVNAHGYRLDQLDLDLVALMLDEPSISVRECARRLGIARGTAQSRIDKLSLAGVISGFEPHINPTSLGFPLRAYVQATIRQVSLNDVVQKLCDIPYIIAADSLAGGEDLTCLVVARDHEHLESVTMMMLDVDGIDRVRTSIVLRHRIMPRVRPLLDAVRAELRGSSHAESPAASAGTAEASTSSRVKEADA